MRKQRIAVVGGDERSERLPWPNHLDIRIYPYKSPRAMERLKDAAATGSIDHAVMLTGYMGHKMEETVRGTNVPFTRWNRSPAQLSREIATMFPPPKQVDNPLLSPTPPDDPMTGGGRGPLTNKLEAVATAPKFEHIVPVPPAPDEKFGDALRRILRAEKLTGKEFSKMIGRSEPTVSGWLTGKSRPADMGPLVDLWPELSRFDLHHEHKAPPTAPAAEQKVRQDRQELIDLVRSVKLEALPYVSKELKEALRRWRLAKLELEAAERELLRLTGADEHMRP